MVYVAANRYSVGILAMENEKEEKEGEKTEG